jgi:glycine hydroxymethyltransferase
LIVQIVDAVARSGGEGEPDTEFRVRGRVAELCSAFPIYGETGFGSAH